MAANDGHSAGEGIILPKSIKLFLCIHSARADVLCELLEVAIHEIIFIRRIYPAGWHHVCRCPHCCSCVAISV